MRPARVLGAAGAATAGLYVLFLYVPISAGHTAELIPWRPLGAWSIGSPAGLAAFYAAILAGLFAAYAVAARAAARAALRESGARTATWLVALAACAILAASPSLLSKDVFDYMGHGRILAIHGANPYLAGASAFPSDAFTQAMGWPGETAIYGPTWMSVSALLVRIAPGSLPGSMLAFKILFVVVHLINGALVGALLRGWGRPALTGQLLYLWNPLVLLQTAGQAHNDAFLVLWVLLGLLFAQRRAAGEGASEDVLAAACFTVSVLTKYVTAPFVGLFLAARLRDGERGSGLRRAATLAAVSAAILVVGYLPYLRGMDLFGFLRPYRHEAYHQGGLPMIVKMVLDKLAASGAAGLDAAAAVRITAFVSAALLVLVAIFGLTRLARTRREEEVARYGLEVLLAYLCVAAVFLRVSYGVWLVALAAALPRGRARVAAFVASVSFMTLEIFWVYAIRTTGPGVSIHREQALATAVAVGAPISYLLAVAARRRLSRAGG